MADVYNFDGFQINQTGVEESDIVSPGGEGSQTYRNFGMRMSSFGALAYGVRSSDDYTLTLVGNFKNKDELTNPDVPSFSQEGEYDDNPYVWGSTVKRTRNDEFTVMLLGNRRDVGAEQPNFDVGDTKNTNGPFDSPKRFPYEGWSSFGGRTAGPANYVAPGQKIV